MKNTHLTQTKFKDLGLNQNIVDALESIGFNTCTPIQEKCLPILIKGQDILGQAQTGTGKTLTFLIGVFNYLLNNPKNTRGNPRAIILAPTRELAIQIHKDAQILVKHTRLKTALAYGGEPYEKQIKKLNENPDIIIGTTGRIVDYLKQGVFNLDHIASVVLDEADRMFDLGFIKDIRYLFNKMPPRDQRFNLLFSATFSFKVKELAFDYMNDPVSISTTPDQMTNVKIKEELFYPSNEDKMNLLQNLIEEEWPDKAIVFANTKASCEIIWSYLKADKHRVGLLTGDVIQNRRTKILNQFEKGEIDILVATDVAARGLHIPAVTYVFNYDLPDDAEDYVHRIGRTGRAGETGFAISFACEQYAQNLTDIENYIKHAIPVSQYNKDALITFPKPYVKSKRHKFNKTKNNFTARNNRKIK